MSISDRTIVQDWNQSEMLLTSLSESTIMNFTHLTIGKRGLNDSNRMDEKTCRWRCCDSA